jgi:sugar (pentulose or hexulose) kinase
MDLLVGVDLGTTACKVTVVNSDLTATSISSPPTRLLHGIVDGLNKIRTPGARL